MVSNNRRSTGTQPDSVLDDILQGMLDSDEDITFRSVVKKHPDFNAPSSLTRNMSRRQSIEEFMAKQQQFRKWRDRGRKVGKDLLLRQMAEKDGRIAELERQVEALRVAYLTMIRAVTEMGGTSKLLTLYERYRGLTTELDKLGVMEQAKIVTLKSKHAKISP